MAAHFNVPNDKLTNSLTAEFQRSIYKIVQNCCVRRCFTVSSVQLRIVGFLWTGVIEKYVCHL